MNVGIVNHDEALPAASVTFNWHHVYVLFPGVNVVELLHETLVVNDPFQQVHEYVTVHASLPVKVKVAF